ncbi:MMPL family transporter [Nocardia nova]|uniref:MMPL family transporter n=1 Tax=Nocardia nova TaxID=37330 RepID=UPI0033DFE57D
MSLTTDISSTSDIPRAKRAQAAHVLADSFTDDPVWQELRPRNPRRAPAALYWIFRCEILVAVLLRGHLLATRDERGDITAVLIAYRRNGPGFPWWTVPFRIPAMILLGPARALEAARMAFAAEGHQPTGDHLYAYYAGARGLGGGATLLRKLMKIAARQGIPVYGEAKSTEMLDMLKVLRWQIDEPIDIGYGRTLTPARWASRPDDDSPDAGAKTIAHAPIVPEGSAPEFTTPESDSPISAAAETAAPRVPGLIGRISSVATRSPKFFLTAIGILFVVLGAVGSPVMGRLSAGGFISPDAESARAEQVLAQDFGLSGMQLVLGVESDTGVKGAAATTRADDIVTALRRDPAVEAVVSPWTDPERGGGLISRDGRTGLIVATVRGDDDSAPKAAHAIAEKLTGSRDGVTVRAGGQSIVFYEANTRAAHDLEIAEAIAMPLCFLLLMWFLRSAIAAAIPIVVGMVSIVGTLAILYALTFVVQLSVFAMNLTSAIGLALAIDYPLLIISRFREEIAGGRSRSEAIAVAVRRAGRAVAFSGLTVAIGVIGMAFFPMSFLRSIAYAGVAVVALSILLALTMVPALLLVLGDRINRKPLREAAPVEQSRLYRIARTVQRRPLLYAVPIIVLLLGLGAPVVGLRLGLPDDRVLPAGVAAHQVGDEIREGFDANPTGTVQIVMTGPGVHDTAALDRYSGELSRVPGVTAVAGPTGSYHDGARLGEGRAEMVAHDSAYLLVSSDANPYSEQARTQLDDLRAVAAPASVRFAGLAQQTRDTATGIADAFPWALVWIAVVTFVLLLLVTGSVVLPLKTLVLNTLSLSATFGAMVWIFQDGHLGGLGTVAPGYLAATVPALVFCTAFGLSMDYEIFLVTRFREEWEAAPGTRADNDTAVAVGLARSGRVITAAAALMAVVFAAVITSQLSLMRMFGLGLTLAVVADATLVRIVLVPAFMRLLGTRNWWAPARLRSVLNTLALRE